MKNSIPNDISYPALRLKIAEAGHCYDMDVLDRAYALAEKAHAGQERDSGRAYITHPVAVAALLLDMGLDTASLAAALLHDVVEDTDIPLEELQIRFGERIAFLVDGVTKLTRIKFSSKEEKQAENLRKMLRAMSKDVRVILIKLCDRLHNMRTLSACLPQKQRDIALSTLEVYAPIAHRLGITNIRRELEDRSLYYLDRVAYDEIVELLGERSGECEHIDTIKNNICQRLKERGFRYVQIRSRVKSVYSMYRKLYVQNRPLEEIHDIYAIRVVLDSVSECYTALGIIHELYHPLPKRFKDYIATPKPNRYQSLHTGLISQQGIAFKVQLRTGKMDQLAKYGVATHWKYKPGAPCPDEQDEWLVWVRHLLESQRGSTDGKKLLRDIKKVNL